MHPSISSYAHAGLVMQLQQQGQQPLGTTHALHP
jgi:hypothetical protein